jgi:WD40 repeat protein
MRVSPFLKVWLVCAGTLLITLAAAPPQNPGPCQEVIHKIQYTPWDLVHAIAWSPDGKTLAVAAGSVVHLISADTYQEKITLDTGSWTPGLAFSPDGSTIASGSRDGFVRVWNVEDGKLQLAIPAHKKGVNSVAFSPNGSQLASGGNDALARVWDLASGELVSELIGGTYTVPGVAFSSGGLDLAILNGKVVRIRDIESTRFVQTIRGENSFFSLDISGDGRKMATGNIEDTVEVWDIQSGDRIARLVGHTGAAGQASALIWQVEFSPSGRLLASAGGDNRVLLWDLENGAAVCTLDGHTKAATSAAFSPDGKILAAGSLDGSLIFWQIAP